MASKSATVVKSVRALGLGAALMALAAGCTSVAQITTLSEPSCEQTVRQAFTKILESEGETPQTAADLAESSTAALQSGGLGPRPFLVESLSGVDYSFFIDKKDASCLLRLYGRQKGFTSYTNNITYIASEPLGTCQCAE